MDDDIGRFGNIFYWLPARMVRLSTLYDGAGRMVPGTDINVFLSGIMYLCIWQYNRRTYTRQV